MKKKIVVLGLIATLIVAGLPFQQVSAESMSRNKLKEIQNQRKSILNEIAKVNKDMAAETKIMQAAEKEIDKINNDPEYKKTEEELRIKEAAYNKEEEKFEQYVVLFYKRGETNYMANLLAADSFNQFLVRFEYVRAIVKGQHKTVERLEKAKEDVQEAKKKWDVLRNKQVDIINQAKAAFEELSKKKSDKQSNLNQYNEALELHEEELIDMNMEDWKNGKLRFPFSGSLIRPVNASITSTFGYRYHPIFGTRKLHEGIDFGAKYGTPVKAAGDGVVISSKASSGYGWLITIYHGDDSQGRHVFTRYAHSYPKQVRVRVGQQVTAGEWITSVGSNGWSTGAHLHFEVRVGNTPDAPAVNPIPKYMQ